MRRPLLRHAVATLGLALAATGLAACGSSNDAAVRSDGSVDLSKVTLTVGDQKGGSQALLSAAGDLDELPYKIDWKPFTSGPPLLDAVSSGAVDVGGVGNTPPLFAIDQKKPIKVVSAYSQGASGDAILIPKGSSIASVADLKGKKVAVAKGSSANYNLLAQLKKAGLSWSDITPVNLQPTEGLAAFKGGSVDAWAIWDPFTSQAQQATGAKVLSDGQGLVNGLAFQVAGDKAIKDKATAAALKDFLGRLASAQVWAAKHKDAWATTWAKETGLDPKVTAAAVARRSYAPLPIGAKVVSTEQQMWDAFKAQKQVTADVDLSSYFTTQFNAVVAEATATAEKDNT
ncbi:ABC transporter substrate-binding protein [Nocardioides korecus]